jgi:hypothetical protein
MAVAAVSNSGTNGFKTKALSAILGGDATITTVGFTASGTYTVPAKATRARIIAVGGGQGGANPPGSTNDVNYAIGGQAGAVVDSTVVVVAGATITVTIGGAATATTVVGSFGTVTAAGGTGQGQNGQDGTYIAGFGFYAGQGCGIIRGGAANYAWAVGTGSPGGGRPAGGVNGYGASSGVANTGAGGSYGTSGASGYAGIVFY